MRVNDSRLFDIGGQRVEIRGDGEGVVSHAGVALLSGLADRVGLTAALGERPRARRQRSSAHDPGAVLRDVAVALADGGGCVSDLAVLRCQPELFGAVASHATVWRTLDRVADDELGGAEGIAGARNRARAQVWDQAGGPPLVEGMVVLDVDVTIVTAESGLGRRRGHVQEDLRASPAAVLPGPRRRHRRRAGRDPATGKRRLGHRR